MKIAIASGKGGTGKTTLSTNLASYIAQFEEVLLCDLDVEEPNSGLFLKMNHKASQWGVRSIPHWDEQLCTNCGQCQSLCNFNALLSLKDQVMIFPELCHSCFACSELCPFGALPMEDRNIGTMDTWDLGQLHFLEGRLNIGEEQAVPLIAQTLKKAQEDFANIIWKIFDAPPGTSCPVIEATRQADLVILVTEPTPFGLHDLTLAVETMKKLNRKVLVVINRYEGPYSPLEEYCSKEGLTILARIPYSLEIAQVYSKGELLYPHIPQVEKVLEGIYQVLKQTEDQG